MPRRPFRSDPKTSDGRGLGERWSAIRECDVVERMADAQRAEAKRAVKDIRGRFGQAKHCARAATPSPNADGA
jgi:hypothetical protein